MRITIDKASGGYRVHVWMAGSNELLFWSDIYASKQGAQRAAYHLKANVGNARGRGPDRLRGSRASTSGQHVTRPRDARTPYGA